MMWERNCHEEIEVHGVADCVRLAGQDGDFSHAQALKMFSSLVNSVPP